MHCGGTPSVCTQNGAACAGAANATPASIANSPKRYANMKRSFRAEFLLFDAKRAPAKGMVWNTDCIRCPMQNVFTLSVIIYVLIYATEGVVRYGLYSVGMDS